MHIHTVKEDEVGVYALLRDGSLLKCPKVNYPMVQAIPSKFHGGPPQMQTMLMQLPCTTSCPFAQVKRASPKELGLGQDEVVNRDIYEISCEGMVRAIVLEGIEEFEKPATKMVSLK